MTETLDAGPIIEQDLQRVTHRHSTKDLIRFGQDREKVVLSRAITQRANGRVRLTIRIRCVSMKVGLADASLRPTRQAHDE